MKKMELIYSKHGEISYDTPFVVLIKDDIEGDMKFSFKLIKDNRNNSYTTYTTVNEHEGLLLISNVKDKGVKSEIIQVGTYQGRYFLYISFVVFAVNKEWNIEVRFMKKNKKDGNK